MKIGQQGFPNNKSYMEEEQDDNITWEHGSSFVEGLRRSVRGAGSYNGIENNTSKMNKPNEALIEDYSLLSKEAFTDLIMLQDLQKLIPKNTPIEKEKLYAETLQLKNMTHKLKEENLRLRTRNLTLEKESNKMVKMVEKSENPTKNIERTLLINLKKQNKELREEIKLKNEEIENFKKNLKITRYQEMETELKTFLEENIRIKNLLDHYVKLNSQIKFEDYQALEEKYYNQSNLLETLQKDITHNKQLIKFLEEENKELKTFKQTEEKNSKKSQLEIAKLKRQIKEKDIEIYRLATNLKYETDLANKKSPKNHVSSNKNHDDNNNLKKLMAQKEKRIEELEKIIRDMSTVTPLLGLDNDKEKQAILLYELESKHKNLQEAYNQLQMAYKDLEDKINLNDTNQDMKAYTREGRHDISRVGKADSRIRITFEDVKEIGYELTLILRLKQISYEELENKLFDQRNSLTPVSIDDLKIILLSDPFELNDINNAYLAARFLYENEDENNNEDQTPTPTPTTPTSTTTAKILGKLKGNFERLIGNYTLITEDVEKELFDGIVQNVMKYEGTIKAYFVSQEQQPHKPGQLPQLETKDNNSVTKNDLIECFKNLDIVLTNDQLDYLILRLYDLSHSLYELDYLKMFDIFQNEDNNTNKLKQIFEIYNDNLNQIKETDSDEKDRDRIKSNPNTSSQNKDSHHVDEENENDSEYFDEIDIQKRNENLLSRSIQNQNRTYSNGDNVDEINIDNNKVNNNDDDRNLSDENKIQNYDQVLEINHVADDYITDNI